MTASPTDIAQDLGAVYQGEILGELAGEYLHRIAQTARERFVSLLILQLETETKAYLRPHLPGYGVEIAADRAAIAQTEQTLAAQAPVPWPEAIAGFAKGLREVYIPRYEAMHAAAVADRVASRLLRHMVEHEYLLLAMIEAELARTGDAALLKLASMLRYWPDDIPIPSA